MIPLQTALPLRGLAAVGAAEEPFCERAYEWLLAQRLEDGAWPSGLASGVHGYVAGYRRLTGPAPLYGRWAYGYWQSRVHYDNRIQLMTVAEEYRKRRIPIDNIIQDWDYWNGAANWSSGGKAGVTW